MTTTKPNPRATSSTEPTNLAALQTRVQQLEHGHRERLAALQLEIDTLRDQIANSPEVKLRRLEDELVRISVHGDDDLKMTRNQLHDAIPMYRTTVQQLHKLREQAHGKYLSADSNAKPDFRQQTLHLDKALGLLSVVHTARDAEGEVLKIRKQFNLTHVEVQP